VLGLGPPGASGGVVGVVGDGVADAAVAVALQVLDLVGGAVGVLGGVLAGDGDAAFDHQREEVALVGAGGGGVTRERVGVVEQALLDVAGVAVGGLGEGAPGLLVAVEERAGEVVGEVWVGGEPLEEGVVACFGGELVEGAEALVGGVGVGGGVEERADLAAL